MAEGNETNSRFRIGINDIFRTKHNDGMIPQEVEVVSYDEGLDLYSMRNIATNAITKHDSDQIQINFIKVTRYPKLGEFNEYRQRQCRIKYTIISKFQ